MLLGLQSNQAYSPADFGLVRPDTSRPPQFQSTLLLQIAGCKHDEGDIARLKEVGISHFTMRLSDSIYEADLQHPTKWQRDPIGYAEDSLRLINRFVRAGVYDYVIDNEPNIIWTQMGYTPGDYAQWLKTVMEHMIDRHMRDGWDLPDGARLGLPPIAFTDEYPHGPWLNALKTIGPIYFDFASVHSYWQSSRLGRTNIIAGPLRSRRFGANYELYQSMWPTLPVQVNEWGNSIHETGQWTPGQIEAFKWEQYPIFLEFAQKAGVEAAHVFISQGATSDWNGFKVSPVLAYIMARSLINAPEPPISGRGSHGGRFDL